jgi:hypothetical protein
MIHEVISARFVKGRVADIGDTLQDRMRQWPKASPEIRQMAEESGVRQAELQEAYEIVSDLATNGDFQTKSDEAAWIPSDPYLSIVQSALEEAYLNADAVAKPTASGLAATRDPVTDLALKPEWVPTADRPLMRQGEETDYRSGAGMLVVRNGARDEATHASAIVRIRGCRRRQSSNCSARARSKTTRTDLPSRLLRPGPWDLHSNGSARADTRCFRR